MSSDVLILGAMIVTIVATTWWALTPVNTDAEDRAHLVDDVFEADAA
jgi:hypothetical protein